VKDRCRCADCTRANTDTELGRRRAWLYGRADEYVDATAARAHFLQLREASIGLRRVSEVVGISRSHLSDLVRLNDDGTPAVTHVRASTERRILSMRPDPVFWSQGRRVDAVGTHRRIQALVAVGHPLPVIAKRMQMKPGQVLRLLAQTEVLARTAWEVADLYATLWDVKPATRTESERIESEQARSLARARQWLPPLAWDDIDTDPAPVVLALTPAPDDVDEIAVERALVGDGVRLAHLTLAEQHEVVRRLTGLGMSVRDIAELLDTTPRTVSRRRVAIRAA